MAQGKHSNASSGQKHQAAQPQQTGGGGGGQGARIWDWPSGPATLEGVQEGLQRLEGRLEEHGAVARVAQLSVAEVAGRVQAIADRVTVMDDSRLPALEQRVQAALTQPLTEEFQATLAALQQALNVPAGPAEPPGVGAAIGAAVQRGLLRVWAAARATAERADEAALFASRKILLGDLPGSGVEGEEVSLVRTGRALLGAAIFLAAVECVYQGQMEARKHMKVRAHQATRPLALGISMVRGITWAAAITASAIQLRRGCHSVAGNVVTSAQRCAERLPSAPGLPPLPKLPAWLWPPAAPTPPPSKPGD